jgi:periplasmic divalent cation tolerance protein
LRPASRSRQSPAIIGGKGKIGSADEQLIYLKTTNEKYDALDVAILKIHPYDTPEILRLPADGGLKKYLTWMVKETT